MPEPTETERWADTILAQSCGELSAIARRGFADHGRGAVFVWRPEARPTEYKAVYVPAEAEALQRAGAHPKDKAGRYDPEREFVAVFVGPNEDLCTVLGLLVAEADASPAPETDA
jgi:hypothetical protein